MLLTAAETIEYSTMLVYALLIITIPQVFSASQNGTNDTELIAVDQFRPLQDRKDVNSSSVPPLNTSLTTSNQTEMTADSGVFTQLFSLPVTLLKFILTPMILMVNVLLYVYQFIIVIPLAAVTRFLLVPLLHFSGLGALVEGLENLILMVSTIFSSLICLLSQLTVIGLCSEGK